MKNSFFFIVSVLFIGVSQGQINVDTVKIGNQVWMKRNLDVTKYRNGDIIPGVTDNAAWQKLTTGAWCYYNNDSAQYAAIYGKLYNWYAVNDPRGLAPAGWHIPNDTEWDALYAGLGGIESAGGKLKEEGTSHWTTPNTGASNSSGFTGLPGGFRFQNGTFYEIGISCSWWSNTAASPTDAWAYGMNNESGSAGNDGSYKRSGFSVRCLRNLPGK